MSILIFGGKGNLGTQLTNILSEDYETFSLDREDLDVLDFDSLSVRVREIRPELIINTVAYNAVDRCEDKNEYEAALRLNVDLPARLADLCLELGIILIHYSSDYVFSGAENKQFFGEDDTPNPINKYGESKARGEQEIIARGKRGLKFYLIRTSKLFGPRGTSENAKPSFFDIMLDLSRNKKELTIVNEEFSCFTYTVDLAAATRRLWESKLPFGIYHLVNEGPVTWHDAAWELFRLKKIEVNIRAVRGENLPRPARRPKFSALKNTRFRKMRSWKIALREYLEVTY
ncbi:MAG: dTDP-4-dehydrorhamnose reductase [Patescibacteria group bacterium]|jgi:dTDP-4-dehydrorhamnose reductase